MDPEVGAEGGARDCIARSDLNRMALSIEQELRAKLREVRIQTVQTYNALKSERIEEESRAVVREVRERRRRMAEYRAMSEGSMRNAVRKRMQAALHGRLLEIMRAAEEELRGQGLAAALVEECVARVGAENLDGFLVYALKRDHAVVREHLARNYGAHLGLHTGPSADAALDGMVRTLPADGLGGVVFFSRDGDVVCDNSFRTRLEIFRERHLKAVREALLGE